MRERVAKLLEEALTENPSLFLVKFEITDTKKIIIWIDGDEGINIKECVRISRHIEHNLDREEEDFELEVSSPGIDQPLMNYRQYKKNVGRKLQIITNLDQQIEGELKEVTENNIILCYKTREPKPIGKGKHTVEKEINLDYNQIKKAVVQITF